MNLIEHVQQAIENAIQKKSKIDNMSQFDAINGMTSQNIQHLLNNLTDNQEVNYLEIGVYNGKSFFAAIEKSNFNSATAIDNFSQIFHDRGTNPSGEFIKHYATFAGDRPNVTFINKDSWTVTREEIKQKINVYFYDGDHSHDAQYKSLTHYYDFMEDEFIFIVDDWSDRNARSGTSEALKNLNLNVLFERELLGQDWWADIKVFVLKKS